MDSDSVSLGSNKIKNLRQTRSGTDPLCGTFAGVSRKAPAIRPSLARGHLGSLDQPMPQQILTIREAHARGSEASAERVLEVVTTDLVHA